MPIEPGAPPKTWRPAEIWYPPANDGGLNLDNEAFLDPESNYSNWVFGQGYRSANLWLYLTIATGTPSIDVYWQGAAPNEATLFSEATVTTGFTTGATWTCFDFGFGSTTLAARILSLGYFRVYNSGGTCTLSAWLALRA